MGRLLAAGKACFFFLVGLLALLFSLPWLLWKRLRGRRVVACTNETLTGENIAEHLDELPPQDLDMVRAEQEPFSARLDAGMRDILQPTFTPMTRFVPFWKRPRRR